MKNYFDVDIVKEGSKWANKSASSLVNQFTEANFGKLKNETGEVIKKLIPTMYGEYKFYWNTEEDEIKTY